MEKGTIIKENVVTMIAPDGSWQPMGTGENLAECVGFIQMLANAGVGMPFATLTERGFKMLPATITIEITGTEEDAFQQMKQQI